MELDLKSTF